MSETLILRFRDLTVERGGTITKHKRIINKESEVWWGWWKRRQERIPEDIFKHLKEKIIESGHQTIYLFHSGANKLFSATLSDIAISPTGSNLKSPSPKKTPDYYSGASYPAWFLLKSIEEEQFSGNRFTYNSFPTRPGSSTLNALKSKKINSLGDIRDLDVTLFVIDVHES